MGMKKKHLKKLKKSDGYQNSTTGAGFLGYDKSVGAKFSAPAKLDRQTLANMYRYDWLSRKIIDRPARDAVKKFIDVDDNEILQLLKRLGVKQKIRKAIAWSRLFGGAAIVLILKDGLTSEDPLDINRVQNIEGLDVLDRYYINDNHDDFFNIGGKKWHKSRVLTFHGLTLTYDDMLSEQGWGGSYLDTYNDAVSDLMIGYKNISHLMAESSMGVLKVPNFALAGNGGSVFDAMVKRLESLNNSKSIYKTLMIDSEENFEWTQRSTDGIYNLIDRFMTQVSAASEIPELVLFGKSPSGLNASQKEQLEVYYDVVSSVQDNIEPQMNTIVEIAANVINAESSGWRWCSLSELTEVEKADIRLKNTQSLNNEVTALQLSDKEARQLAKRGDSIGLYDDLDDED